MMWVWVGKYGRKALGRLCPAAGPRYRQNRITANNLLKHLVGAHITVMEEGKHIIQIGAIQAKVDELTAQGKKVYWPRRESTIDLDVIAYVEVGVALGLGYLESPIKVRGFCPLPNIDDRHQDMANLANQAAHRLGLDTQLSATDFDNDDTFVGEGYGLPSPEGLNALRTLARTEGILLDPVYTSKALAGLLAHVADGRLDGEAIFLHTGGSPALFAYAQDVLSG